MLEQNNIRVRALSGVSAGGVVAVLHALGINPAAIRDFIAGTHLLELWQFGSARRGLLGTSKLRARLRTVVGDNTFADLSIPVVLVAADLDTGKEVYLEAGRLDDALIATMALPGVFPPQPCAGQLGLDGGLVNPVPVEAAQRFGGPVVAVDLLGDSGAEERPQIFEANGATEYATRLGRRLGLVDTVEVVYQAAMITTRRLRDYQLQAHPPEVLIRPAVGKVGLFASDLADYAYQQGEAAARAALPEINRITPPAFMAQIWSQWRHRAATGRNSWPSARH